MSRRRLVASGASIQSGTGWGSGNVGVSGGGGTATEWEVLRAFNSGSVGTAANGTADGFDSAASRSLYTTEQVFDGSQACKVQMLVADGTGFGEYGGIVSFPSEAFAGDVLWLDVMVYFGDGVDLTAMRNSSKFLRFRTETSANGNAGYIDLYLSSEGARGATMFSAIKEGVFSQGPANNGWFPMGLWSNLTKNTWHRVSMCCGLGATSVSNGGTGFLKVWFNGALLLDSTAFRSLTSGTDKATDLYFATQWNDGVTVDQSWYADRIRMAKNGTPSWALSLEGVAGASAFFSDEFAGGQVNPSNGVTYSNTEGGLDQSEVVSAASTGLADTDGASWLLRTRYLAQPLGSNSANGQVNMSLGRECNELWVEWRYFCPSNYEHRDNTSVDNNKFVMAWKEPYSSGTHQVGCELERGTAPVDSVIRPLMRFSANQNGATAGTYTRIEAGVNNPLIGDNGPIVPGTWNTVRWYTRKASALGTADGVWKMWVNGTLVREFTGLHMGSNDPLKFANGLNALYFFGAANSGYTNDTTFYTRRITFYDTDPGWV